MSRVKAPLSDPYIRNIVRACYPDYRGRKVVVEAREQARVMDFWDGPSRTYATFLDLATLRTIPAEDFPNRIFQTAGNPLGLPIFDIPMREGIALVEHVFFCGRDLGIRIVVHPVNLGRYLPSYGTEKEATS